MLGEFDNVTDVLKATQAAHDAGYRQMDVHSPFPIHGIDEALDIKPTILPWLVLGMGLTGMSVGIFLTTFTMTDFLPQPDLVPANFEGYRFLISGKPFNSFAAYIPVIFELTIMFTPTPRSSRCSCSTSCRCCSTRCSRANASAASPKTASSWRSNRATATSTRTKPPRS